jgi:hypothetical protein
MMAGRNPPRLASVTIRRLVLPQSEAGQGMGDGIADAIAGELGCFAALGATPHVGVAEAIARGVATHPRLGAIGLLPRARSRP